MYGDNWHEKMCTSDGDSIKEQLMKISVSRKTEMLNEELQRVAPGYYIRANEFGPVEWEMVGPDGIVHYRRDKFDQIIFLALGREKGEALLKKIEKTK